MCNVTENVKMGKIWCLPLKNPQSIGRERHIKKIKVTECSNLTDEIIIRYSGLGGHLTEAMAGVFTLFRKHEWE